MALMRVLRVLLVFFTISHWVGCIWVVVGDASGVYPTSHDTVITKYYNEATGSCRPNERAFLRGTADREEWCLNKVGTGVLYVESFYWASHTSHKLPSYELQTTSCQVTT